MDENNVSLEGSSSSLPPCSCACWEITQQLNDKVRIMELQLEKYSRWFEEFEDIKDKFLNNGNRNHSNEGADDMTRNPKLDALNDKVPDEEKNIGASNNDVRGGINHDNEYLDCVIVKSFSLSTTSTCYRSTTGTSSKETENTGSAIGRDSNMGYYNNTINDQSKLRIAKHSDASSSSGVSTSVTRVKETEKKQKRSGAILKGNTCAASLGRESLICPHCSNGHVFYSKNTLRRHILHFHENPRINYECVKCKRRFRFKEGLTYHMGSSHGGTR